MSIQRQRGNTAERAIAARLGGQRVGQYGGEDVTTSVFSIEVKSRESVPKWLTHAIEQAEAHAPDGKLPLAVIHTLGQRHDDDLVVLRLSAFEEWFGETEEKQA